MINTKRQKIKKPESFTSTWLSSKINVKSATLKKHARFLYGIDPESNKGRGKVRRFKEWQCEELFIFSRLTRAGIDMETAKKIVDSKVSTYRDAIDINNSIVIEVDLQHLGYIYRRKIAEK